MYKYSIVSECKKQNRPKASDISMYILALIGLVFSIWVLFEIALIFTPYTSIFKFLIK